MEQISKRLSALAASQTLAMSQKSNELKAAGKDVINLSIGEPDFNTPDYVKDAAKKAIDDNFSFYSPVGGYKDLLEAVCAKLKRENNLTYSTSQIVVSAGAKHALSNVFLSLLNPGDEVLIPTPYWVSYPEMVKLAEAKPVFIPTNIKSGFKVTAAQVEKTITSKTRMFVFSSPSNPCGAVYTKQELADLANLFAKNPQIFVVADEIYEHINYVGEHQSIAQFEEIKNQVVIVNGVSKAYAMTGWRIGYIAAPEWVAKACTKLQGQVTSGVCSIAQKAAVAALNGGLEYPKQMTAAYLRRRDMFIAELSKIEGLNIHIPDGAFYVFAEVTAFLGKTAPDGTVIKKSGDLAMYLLTEGLVASVSGEGFGNPECIRFSFATSDELLKKAAERIKVALEKLK
ncbi:MAG: pyridoxal phosphate-dependent aminotransferase [Bacteroidales bacterium]|nr:pyridoxal phosphate-dependent aminotransferase [Bacteroidales bacterium]MBP5724675.1 pyridoxal phosphate-dependent aminotransferase [Bacteroidales bacterium]MBQ3677515.1 pyridoxal phosphate-dependent aminotransferase [Bacteroidales bacterium]MBR4497051.1 pyridoxal phosphate-dependent aminotransferase [Bacteroidales bacterium]MBR4690470.1 pyridoxal phosphate-dependent aminotransferase [Bacteroidales bacterium]